MNTAPYFHVGVIVADLDEAIATSSKRLGLSFTDPVVGQLKRFVVNGSPAPTRVLFAYSLQGPPYYELIEAHDDGFFGREAGLGVHHLGIWSPDLELAIAEHAARGIEVEAVNYGVTGKVEIAYLKAGGLLGVRHELISEAHRSTIETRIAGHIPGSTAMTTDF